MEDEQGFNLEAFLETLKPITPGHVGHRGKLPPSNTRQEVNHKLARVETKLYLQGKKGASEDKLAELATRSLETLKDLFSEGKDGNRNLAILRAETKKYLDNETSEIQRFKDQIKAVFEAKPDKE